MFDFLTYLAAILGIGSLTLATVFGGAFVLFKWLGTKWMEQKFQERLELFRTEQVREIERMRHRINGLFDRTVRLHSKEFEVLPDVWGKLVEAHGFAGAYVSSFQQYSDVSRLPAPALKEFLDKTEFSDTQKQQILDCPKEKILDTYVRIYELHRYAEVREKIRNFLISFRKGGIFIQPSLKNDMQSLLEIIDRAVVERQINIEHNARLPERGGKNNFEDQGKKLLDKIEESIFATLWSSTETEI